MNIVCDKAKRVMGVGCWADGFVPLRGQVMTLEEEVRKNGLAPVVNRLKRLGNFEKAEELMERYQH
ncbi:MAG: hypothetical protein WC823_00665 [Parcubacteria group bacterium]|jgi:hypothetical protein